MEERTLTMADGKELFLRVWNVDNPKATVHINHGMAEHGERYDEFAKALCDIGCAVYAQDHRGHGGTIKGDEKGYFADKDGWKKVVEDAMAVDRLAKAEHPNLPHILFGHSMGSFVSRICLSVDSSLYSGAIICGTGASQGIVGKVGKFLADKRAKKYGAKHKDELLSAMAFGPYAKHFPGEGVNGWLSRDKKVVEAYSNDELCGFVCTSSFFSDLMVLISKANSGEEARKIRKDLPMLIVSGEDDPVGGYGKGVRKVYSLYKAAGLSDVRLTLFPGGRHEILNEINREEVVAGIVAFVSEVINGR